MSRVVPVIVAIVVTLYGPDIYRLIDYIDVVPVVVVPGNARFIFLAIPYM